MKLLLESLLEAHFFAPLMRAFVCHFRRPIVVLKPAENREVWLGFDYGFMPNMALEVRREQTETDIRNAIEKGTWPSLYKGFVGYFMQYKVGECMIRDVGNAPSGFTYPFYRFKLDLKRRKPNQLSQHETLARLHGLGRADVMYACPMVFDEATLWRPYETPAVDILEQLVLVDIANAPQSWASGQQHSICFPAPTSRSPMWCSDPMPASAFGPRDWFEARLRVRPIAELPDFLRTVREATIGGAPELSPLAPHIILLGSQSRGAHQNGRRQRG